MDGILGIVSEYNPFHNGHVRHLQLSKQLTKTDFTVAVMSGNFVQRGDTALVDKWTRSEMALKSGIDLVIELPTVYALSIADTTDFGILRLIVSDPDKAKAVLPILGRAAKTMRFPADIPFNISSSLGNPV